MEQILINAQAEATRLQLKYAGDILPEDAWQLVQANAATIVDVRSSEELKLVGYIPDVSNVPWLKGLKLEINPSFILELGKVVNKTEVLLLICRSGKRSVAASEAATRAGFSRVFNVKHGVETIENGWSHKGLPWIEGP